MGEESQRDNFVQDWLRGLPLAIPQLLTMGVDALLMMAGYSAFSGDIRAWTDPSVFKHEDGTPYTDQELNVIRARTMVSLAYGPAALKLATGSSEVGALTGVGMLVLIGAGLVPKTALDLSLDGLQAVVNPDAAKSQNVSRSLAERSGILLDNSSVSDADKTRIRIEMFKNLALIQGSATKEEMDASLKSWEELLVELEALYGVA